MEPLFSEGYYVSQRGDTILGEIQNNRPDETLLYHEFAFKKKGTTRARVMNTRLVRAYGFDGRDFVLVNSNGDKFFAERLVYGRLAFYEYQFHGKVDGVPAVESAYFVRDTWEQTDEKAKEKVVSKISPKFYKKSLKPFMKDEQPMIWSDLDKFNFSKEGVVNAISEFNTYYNKKAN